MSFLANTNKNHKQDREELQKLKWQRLEHYSVHYLIPKEHAGMINMGCQGVSVLPIKQRNVVIKNLWSFFPGIKYHEHIKLSLPKKVAHRFLIYFKMKLGSNCKGTSRITLSHHWGSVLLVAHWQSCTRSHSSCLLPVCVMRRDAFYSIVRTLWLLIHVLMWWYMWSSSVEYIY